MANLTDNELQYLSWSDRAAHFYLAARLLWSNNLFMPSLFCAQQSVETLLKAACFYFDTAFAPQAFGHELSRLEHHLKSLNPAASKISVPVQFYHEGRWQAATRCLPTYSNEVYDVQRSDILISGSWSNIATDLSGPCGVLRHIDVGATSATSQFYRVRTHF